VQGIVGIGLGKGIHWRQMVERGGLIPGNHGTVVGLRDRAMGASQIDPELPVRGNLEGAGPEGVYAFGAPARAERVDVANFDVGGRGVAASAVVEEGHGYLQRLGFEEVARANPAQ
jgi:hypothetical protein